VTLIVLAVGFGVGHLAWDNPMPVWSRGFWIIAELRATTILVMVIVSVCQALATVSFQTVTNNRIITPSIMGFESLYVAVQTAAVYFLAGRRLDHHRARRWVGLPLRHPQKGAPVITLANVRKTYGGEVTIGQVDLTIPAGGVTALVGPNGAAISTSSPAVSVSAPTWPWCSPRTPTTCSSTSR